MYSSKNTTTSGVSEESLQSTELYNGSITNVSSSDLSLEGRDVFKVPSGTHLDESDKYTIDQLVHSTNETVVETDQIRRLEKSRLVRTASKKSLFPGFTDDFLENVQNLKGGGDDLSHDEKRPSSAADLYYANETKRPASKRNSSKERPVKRPSKESFAGDIESAISSYGEESDISRQLSRWERITSMGIRVKEDLLFFKEFIEPHKRRFGRSFKLLFSYLMLPSLIIACFLFYGFDNPPTKKAMRNCADSTVDAKITIDASKGAQQDAERRLFFNRIAERDSLEVATNSPTLTPGTKLSPTITPTRKPKVGYDDFINVNSTHCPKETKALGQASISWWFLFLGVRQVITYCLAELMQLIFIDFLMFRTRFFPRVIGTRMTLALGQSKGWPCLTFCWALADLCFLFGNRKYSQHWLYYQDSIEMMNSVNPSGDIPNNKYYKQMIYLMLGLSVAVTVKRAAMANFVGKRVVCKFIDGLVSSSNCCVWCD